MTKEIQTRLVKAALYIRVSTLEQATKGASIEAQEDLLRRWAAQEDIEVVKVYKDEVTAKDMERPGIQQLLNEAKSGDFSVLMCYHNDRLNRNTIDALQTVKDLYKSGVMTRFYNFDVDINTPEGEMLFTMMASFAQYFLRDLSRKTKLGMDKKAEQGVYCGRLPEVLQKIDPAGPQNRDNLQLNPEFEEQIKKIILLRGSGRSWRSIAGEFNSSDHKKFKRMYQANFWLNGDEENGN